MSNTLLTKPITVVTHNSYRSNHAQTVALQCCDTDIILFTEPWWGEIGSGNFGSVSHPDYTCILPVLAPTRRPRAMAYFRRRADFQVVPRPDIAVDHDFLFLVLKH